MYWLGLGIIIIALIIACIIEDKYNVKLSIVCLLVIGSALGGLFMAIDKFGETNNPSALDVYRHKTTLKITYVGGEPIDTLVVFKKLK